MKTPEPIEPEVLPATTGPPDQMRRYHEHFEETIRQADSKRRQAGNFTSLMDTWEDLKEHHDPNAMILDNLKELQLLIKDHMTRFIADSARNDEKMMGMLDDPNIDDVKWAAAYGRFDESRRKNLKLARDLMNCGVRLASEHRQCLQQSKFMFHISRILEVRLTLLAILTKELHDQRILNRIGTALETAFNKLYPASATSEAKPRE